MRIEIEREHLNVDGRDVRLVPGMSVTADLLTGETRAGICAAARAALCK